MLPLVEWIPELRRYLLSLYAGVFSDDAIETHIRDYIGHTFAEFACSLLSAQLIPGSRVLDIGSGFGTCVLMARETGFDACGIEPAEFEVDFARKRLASLRPGDDPQVVYRVGTAEDLVSCIDQFHAITLWNVLEHIPHTKELLRICHRLLLPGGKLFIIAPNYFAFRDEAHYHIPWTLLDYLVGQRFIKRIIALNKNPDYFQKGIIPITNWEVLFALRELDFSIADIYGNAMPLRPSRSFSVTLQRLRFWNPLVESLLILAEK
jgi:2-polyprenyl-3-methyl-5-hydroxy-6-metoxy-1,4-benzoquinol methylase